MDKAEFLPLISGPVQPGTPPAPAIPEQGSGDARRAVDRMAAVSREALDEALERLNADSAAARRNLAFSVAEASGRVVITVLDAQSREVIREIPPEKLLAVSESLEELHGLLFEARV